MTERLITHLRHIDLAVPDHAKQLDFFTGAWGLTTEHSDTGLTFLAAEGSPEQYVVRLRQADDKRIDLIAFGAASAADVDALAARLAGDGVRLVSEPGALATPGGGYGFRFFDNEGRTVEVSADVAVRAHRTIEEGESIPVRLSHVVVNSADPGGDGGVVRTAPGVRAVRHPHAPADGRDDVLPADQPLAPQPRGRPLPAPVAAPRLIRAARHRRVHARHRPPAAGGGGEDLGARTSPGRQQHLQLLPRPARQHRRVHHRARASSTRTPGTRTCTTSPSPESPTSGAPRTR